MLTKFIFSFCLCIINKTSIWSQAVHLYTGVAFSCCYRDCMDCSHYPHFYLPAFLCGLKNKSRVLNIGRNSLVISLSLSKSFCWCQIKKLIKFQSKQAGQFMNICIPRKNKTLTTRGVPHGVWCGPRCFGLLTPSHSSESTRVGFFSCFTGTVIGIFLLSIIFILFS